MSKKFPIILSLAGTVALATMGTFNKPAVAGDARCDTSSSNPTLILSQQSPMLLNVEAFDSKKDALQQCQQAAEVLNRNPNYTVMVAEILESGESVICLREDEIGGCDENDALKFLKLKSDINPTKAMLDMLGMKNDNPTRPSIRGRLPLPFNLLNPFK